MSFWPFAVSLLALIGCLIWAFSASSERDNALRTAERAKADRTAMEDERNAANAKVVAISGKTGFQAGSTSTDPAEIDRQIKEYGPKLRDAMTITVPVSRYQADTTGSGGVIVKADGGMVTVVYLTDAELQSCVTVQDFLSKFEVAAHRLKFDIDRSIAASEQFQRERESVIKADQESIAAKDKRIADLTGEKAALDNQMREKETELKDQIAQITSQKDAKDTELETFKKQADANEKKLLALNNEQAGQIRSLVQRDAPLLTEGPDGEVIVADNGIAIVNRGKAQFLMPGTMFDVWGLAKGGTKYKKGTIKVTSCDDETARAAIVEEDSRNPITKGDLIQSLTYSPNHPIHFVIAGDMKKMGRSTAEAVLKKLGAVVDPTVTAATNYLVVGDFGAANMDDNAAVKAAKDLGIRMITEEQLGSFTRY
jgi:hypothetical protein